MRQADTKPKEVAEADFGCLRLVHDPDTGRRAKWALIVVLGYSKHCSVWPTCGQSLFGWPNLRPDAVPCCGMADEATESSTLVALQVDSEETALLNRFPNRRRHAR